MQFRHWDTRHGAPPVARQARAIARSGQVEADRVLHPMPCAIVGAPTEYFSAAVDVLDARPRAVAKERVQQVHGAVLKLLVHRRGEEGFVKRFGDAVHAVARPPLVPEVFIAAHVGGASDSVKQAVVGGDSGRATPVAAYTLTDGDDAVHVVTAYRLELG